MMSIVNKWNFILGEFEFSSEPLKNLRLFLSKDGQYFGEAKAGAENVEHGRGISVGSNGDVFIGKTKEGDWDGKGRFIDPEGE
jgi:hypothetical protein